MLLTTHYMEEADQLCDRLAIIDHGRVLALDTPADLKRRSAPTRSSPSSPTATWTLLAKLLHEQVPASHEADPTEGSVELTARAPPASCPRSSARPSSAGFDLTDLRVAEPTLETVFIRLTGKELRD